MMLLAYHHRPTIRQSFCVLQVLKQGTHVGPTLWCHFVAEECDCDIECIFNMCKCCCMFCLNVSQFSTLTFLSRYYVSLFFTHTSAFLSHYFACSSVSQQSRNPHLERVTYRVECPMSVWDGYPASLVFQAIHSSHRLRWSVIRHVRLWSFGYTLDSAWCRL